MPITDLTGTKWLLNSEPMFGDDVDSPLNYIRTLIYAYDSTAWVDESDRDVFQIDAEGVNAGHLNFTSNNENFVGLMSEDYIPLGDEEANFVQTYSLDDSVWYDEAYRTIEITGGTDATNTDLINWLQENATQIIEPTGNTYTLTHTLTNLTKGNITIQITPDTNYTYPTSLTISNGTLVSYDNTTGIAVINGDDTTIVNAECAEQASGYNLTINGTVEAGGFDHGSKITINNTTCSVDYLGNTTNIPHTFTGVTTFEIEPNHTTPNYRIDCSCKIISGSGTYINGDYPNGHAYQAGNTIIDESYGKIIITMTSDTVIQLGYYEE